MYNQYYQKIVGSTYSPVRKRLQDYFPYNKTIVGLEGHFTPIGDNKFYINSQCIAAYNKTIITGHTYILLNRKIYDLQNESSCVKLVDAFYHNGSVYLQVQDLLTKRNRVISQDFECPKDKCSWLLIDVDYLNRLLNKITSRIVNKINHFKNIHPKDVDSVKD